MIYMSDFDLVREVRQKYCCHQVAGILSDLVIGGKCGIQFSSEHVIVNVFTDGSIRVLGRDWDTQEALRNLDMMDSDMAAVVRNTLDKFKK